MSNTAPTKELWIQSIVQNAVSFVKDWTNIESLLTIGPHLNTNSLEFAYSAREQSSHILKGGTYN